MVLKKLGGELSDEMVKVRRLMPNEHPGPPACASGHLSTQSCTLQVVQYLGAQLGLKVLVEPHVYADYAVHQPHLTTYVHTYSEEQKPRCVRQWVGARAGKQSIDFQMFQPCTQHMPQQTGRASRAAAMRSIGGLQCVCTAVTT